MNIHPFQTKSKFATVTVNNVYSDPPAAAFQLSESTWVLAAVPIPYLGIAFPHRGNYLDIRLLRDGDYASKCMSLPIILSAPIIPI